MSVPKRSVMVFRALVEVNILHQLGELLPRLLVRAADDRVESDQDLAFIGAAADLGHLTLHAAVELL